MLDARKEYLSSNYPEDYRNYVYSNKTKFIQVISLLTDDKTLNNELNVMSNYVPQPMLSGSMKELEQLETIFKKNIEVNSINKSDISLISDRNERKRIYYANNYSENVQLLTKIVELRKLIAKEHGYANWQSYNIIDSMTNKMNVAPIDIILKAYEKCKPYISNEIKLLREAIGVDELWEYDVKYAMKVYQNKNVIAGIEKYFPHDRVIDRALQLIGKAFDGKFVKQQKLSWQWTVNTDGMHEYHYYNNNEHSGTIFFDTHNRPGKSRTIAATHQIIVRCVYSPKGSDIPTALIQTSHNKYLSLTEIIELFHELGHAMHVIKSCNYTSIFAKVGFNNIPYDYIETPSQSMENYCHDPCVIKYLSTGISLLEAKKLIEVHQQFYHIDWMNTIGQALFDTEIHTSPSNAYNLGEQYNKILENTTGVKREHKNSSLGSFAHMIDYSGRYYSYIFSRMLADQNKPEPTHTLGVTPPKPH